MKKCTDCLILDGSICGPCVDNSNFVQKVTTAHYREIEKKGIEPIVVMEELIDRLIGVGVPAKNAGLIMLAQKHITRAGLKSGDGWEKDIQKSLNYLNRALTGKWLK